MNMKLIRYLFFVIIAANSLLIGCHTENLPGNLPEEAPEEETEKEPGKESETEAGEVESSLELNPKWENGDSENNDLTNGEKGQYYYNYVLESTFNPQVQMPEMAIADNILYVPTGTYGWRPTDLRNVRVEYWNLTTGQKTGTLPMPQGMTSFTYLVHSLFRIENLLFVGHGENYGQNRVEVYDISQPSFPRHITYIGGGQSYLPTKPDNKLIGVPYAVWGKDGRILLLDNFRLSVYEVSSLTADKAGSITPIKFMPITSTSGDEPGDQAAFVALPNGSLYLTDPSRSSPKGLRKIAWENVISATTGEVNNLIDNAGLRLPGMTMKKVMALDDKLLVFNNDITNNRYSLTYFEPAQSSGTDCTIFFKPSLQKPTNAMLLNPTSDNQRRMILSQGDGSIAIYRIDKIYLNNF